MNSNNTIQINPNQNSISTRISSKNKQNALFVDGVNDKIGINTSTPDEMLHIIGNLKVGSSTADGISIGSYEDVTHPSSAPITGKALSTMRELSFLRVYGACTYTLGPGFDGQKKYITFGIQDSAGSATITLTGNGFTTITMDAVGDCVGLQYINSKWSCISNIAVPSSVASATTNGAVLT